MRSLLSWLHAEWGQFLNRVDRHQGVCKHRGRCRRWLAASLVLGFILAFTCTPLSTMFRRSDCKPIEQVSSTHHCPLAAMLRDRFVFSSRLIHRLRACHVVFYNRVPKCASRTVLGIFQQLACQNGFKYYSEMAARNNFYITRDNVVSFAQGLMNTTEPLLFSKHIHFINFSSLNLWEPAYINVIRDPLQRALSHYSYRVYGSNNKPLSQPQLHFNISLNECAKTGVGPCWNMNQILPYFCGHHHVCRKGGVVALNRAKRTVREKYLLVGLTEDLPAFMETLSYIMPHFFNNATAIYDSLSADLWYKYKTVKKQDITKETEAILREHLSLEIDFYKFVRQRFYHIHSRVRRLKEDAFLQGLWKDDVINVTSLSSRDNDVIMT